MNKVNEEAARASAPAAKTNPRRYWLFACAIVALGIVVERSAAGHREHENRDIWFIHATDPHLFIPPGKAGREEQQRQNQEALSDLLKYIGSLSESNDPLSFLVLTGDLGVDPCDIRQVGNQPSTATPTPTPTPTPTVQRSAPPAAEAEEAIRQHAPSVDDCLKVAPDQRASQITITARILSQSPVPDIYLIAGHNDIAGESAGEPALKYFNDFIQDVQKELIKNKSRVNLHNLTRCYLSGEAAGACSADIPQSAYRLIGFPSYSFKKSEEKAQGAQFEKFHQLLEDSRKQGMKALVITHSPQMDDPFALAQQRYVHPKATPSATPRATPSATPTAATATASPAETATPAETPTPAGTATPAQKTKKAQTQPDKSSSVSIWNVSEPLLDDWQEVITSDSTEAVFAGHLHDSHKEIYRRPYAWSSGSAAAFRKLFLAPPLAVKNQDTSPIQARGFSLVHLQPDRIESRLFWYDSETRAFTSDSKPKPRCERRGFWRSFCQGPRTVITWLWNLDKADDAMVRMAVLLIAFLTAFLTIVAIWQFPPSSDQFEDDKKSAAGEPKTTQGASNASTDSSPFANRFGKTVIAGLSGLAVTEIAKALGNQQPSADTKWYYIVWFILFFFFLLVLLNLWRALVEASRARVAVIHYPLGLPGSVRTWDRFTHWLSSLRVPLLTFSDTFINLIQGKNQTRTKVFEDKIIDQQQNVIRVADAIRTSLSNLIEARVRQKRQDTAAEAKAAEAQRKAALAAVAPAAVAPAAVAPAAVAPAPVAPAATVAPAPVPPARVPSPDELNLVRVNISVLSKDQTSVFYVSRAPGSSHSQFPKKSMAWVSVFTGQIRWYQSSYRKLPNYEQIVLFDNHTRNDTRVIPGDDDLLMLKDYYRVRSDEDYQAFVIFPVPSPRRGFGSDYVKGAIHISFRENSDLDSVWNATAMEPVAKPATGLVAQPAADTPLIYPTPQRTLEDWCRDPGVRAALSNSIAILGELLRGFNEIIYKNYIESRQSD